MQFRDYKNASQRKRSRTYCRLAIIYISNKLLDTITYTGIPN